MQTSTYLSDMPERLTRVNQGWGELGLDVAAHATGQAALPLQIGAKRYAKGLGHHASGAIVVDLDGRYAAFDAEVGVQQQNSAAGSVVFRVFVDGRLAFESGVMRQDTPAMPVHLPVVGADVLKLECDDAGDGIVCDCADWADARLSTDPKAKPAEREPFDVAPFGEVTTWDPARMDGVRSKRIEELAEDEVYLDQPVRPVAGGYPLPKTRCIGLLWLERRWPDTLSIAFNSPANAFLDQAEVQAWTGMYPFQGTWKKLNGRFTADGNALTFAVDPGANPDFAQGFRKVRWVFPGGLKRGVVVKSLVAGVDSRMKTATIRLESASRAKATVQGVDCELLVGDHRTNWDGRKPLELKVRFPAGARWSEAASRPALRIRTKGVAFAVELQDVLNGGVYLKDQGLLLSSGEDLATTKARLAGKQTVLERVRTMPDQSFERAMERTYRPIHFGGPTLLALGSDNWKWLVAADGSVCWLPGPEPPEKYLFFEQRRWGFSIEAGGKALAPSVDRSLAPSFPRWAPATFHEGDGVRCVEYVAPTPSNKALFLTRLEVGAKPVQLRFTNHRTEGIPAEVKIQGSRAIVMDGDRLMAVVDLGEARATAKDGVLSVAAGSPDALLVAAPGWEAKADDPELSNLDEAKLSERFVSFWRAALADGMKVELPDKLLQDVITSSQVRCIVDARNAKGGEQLAPWIGEIHYGPLESEANTIIRGMAMMGHADFSRRCLDYFIGIANPAGYVTTGYTLVGTGWHLWTLGETYALQPDQKWLKRHADDVVRIARWVIAQRRKTMKLDPLGRKPPQYGLVTPGVIADWDAYQYYFYSNGTYCAGLEAAGRALKAIGRPEGEEFIQEAAAFKKDIVRAYRWAQARTPVVQLQDGTWAPGYPSQVHCTGPLSRYYEGEDGTRSWCYDVEIGPHNIVQQGILPANGKDAAWMADHMEDVMYLDDGWGDYPAEQTRKDWFDLGGFAKVQPYYARLTEVYAMRDDVKPFIRSYFNMLASLVNPYNLTIWEHFGLYGAPDKTHETGVFLQQTRFMLVDERGDELWLAPFVTNHWMQDGMSVSVQDAPTRFGKVSFSIVSHVAQGFIEARVKAPSSGRPSAIVLRLRHPEGLPMKSVLVNGKPWKRFDAKREVVRLTGVSGEVTVKAIY